ncbi:bifunctional 2-polyprenyl-6-hydroxyphenol methylase/3-demethylubiquinol 3-O-methyltransferase UbiG [Cellulophaga sp. HaHa_2_1]|uniref:class I SAM-dependent methyltransferase n=1 Tax=Cellulophaga sp. HaHa_2_1 TaxID=2749994 RepID=UPI001C4EEA6D|nr:class I SAM-dependent methyltransferase [Cellulophaga sp. HaHa_2_1]QXP53795.1 class I SAM-dependent methyltransferase [Cellulophaga sp. HaHa_2_1]
MIEKAELKYKEFWNERYQDTAFAYGKEPNTFFKEQMQKLKTGSILMPAEGEGRNAVFAAKLGWNVTATDLSIEGKNKAERLAEELNVSLKYIVGDLEELEFQNESYDTIALIYAHFSPWKISAIHQKLKMLLKPGGIIIFEAFSKKHLDFQKINPKVGGPRDLDMLFSLEQVQKDFLGFEVQILEECEVLLSEGGFHNGRGSVIRFVGKKR